MHDNDFVSWFMLITTFIGKKIHVSWVIQLICCRYLNGWIWDSIWILVNMFALLKTHVDAFENSISIPIWFRFHGTPSWFGNPWNLNPLGERSRKGVTITGTLLILLQFYKKFSTLVNCYVTRIFLSRPLGLLQSILPDLRWNAGIFLFYELLLVRISRMVVCYVAL